MHWNSRILNGTVLATSLLMMTACESSGGTRLAGIGAGANSGGGSGGTGIGGDGTGGTGTGSGTGTGGDTGGNGTGGTSTGGTLTGLPIGSITGNGGVAGTGILSNVGQPGQTSPLSPVLVTAGNAALGLGELHNTVATVLNGVAPPLEPATDAVTQVLTNAGIALNGAASGQTPLVDGLTSAVSPVVTIAAGGTTLIGNGAGGSLVAISAGSPATGSGSLVDLHLAKGNAIPAAGNLLGAQVAHTTLAQPSGTPVADVQLLSPNAPAASALGIGVASGGKLLSVTTPVTGGGSQTALGGVVQTVTGAVLPAASGILGGGSVTGAGGPVGSLLSSLPATVPAPGGNAVASATAPVKSVLGGLLHH